MSAKKLRVITFVIALPIWGVPFLLGVVFALGVMFGEWSEKMAGLMENALEAALDFIDKAPWLRKPAARSGGRKD